jgi:hypothetical protein
MPRKPLLVVVVLLLSSVVGYLALDRHEKDVSNERNRTFDQKFAR